MEDVFDTITESEVMNEKLGVKVRRIQFRRVARALYK